MMTLLAILGLCTGLWLLTRSADWFVSGAAVIAKRFRIPAFLIGFLIIGFGTSLPEMAVSALASLQGLPLLALGNAYGSNIANIFLILGICILVAPIAIHKVAIWRDIPMLLGTLLLTFFLSSDGQFSQLDGIILLLIFAGYCTCQIIGAMRHPAITEDTVPASINLTKAIGLTLAGLILLLGASELLVYCAKYLALKVAPLMGLDAHTTDLIIGLTIVAIGTSLPELMSSIAALKQGESDIALGNVVGSNLFNTLIVVGIALSIHGIPTNEMPISLRIRDLGTLLFATLLLQILCLIAWKCAYKKNKPYTITLHWATGILFLIFFISYLTWVFLGSR